MCSKKQKRKKYQETNKQKKEKVRWEEREGGIVYKEIKKKKRLKIYRKG